MGRSRQHANCGDKRAIRGFRARSIGIALSGLAVMLFAGGTSVAYGASSGTSAQQTDAVVKPSLVYIQIDAKGYIMGGVLGQVLATANGGSAPAITASASCSGAVVSPSGSILTAGHCVDSQSVQGGAKGMIIDKAIAIVQQSGAFTSAETQALYQDAVLNGKVEGTETGSPPDMKFTVYPSNQASGAPDPKGGLPASVVSVKSFKDGDVAVLKTQPSFKLPALQAAPAAPDSGTPIVAAGFPGAVTENVDIVHLNPTLSPGEVSGAQSVEGTPVTQISANTSQGMSGGPVVDSQGRIVGTVSWGVTGANKVTFNFMTNTDVVKAVLASANVPNTLSTADQTYRTGLNQYFAGQYHDAAATFQQVLDVQPNQPGAQYYKAQAIQNYPNEKSSSMLWLWILIGVVALALIGGGTAFLLTRRRKKGEPMPPAAPGEVPTAVAPTAEAPPVPAPTAEAPPAPAPTAEAPPAPAPTAVVPEPPGVPAPVVGGPEPDGHGGDGHGGDGHGGDGHGGDGHAGEAAEEGAAPAPKQVFCPNCGAPHDPSTHFCVSCGTRFEEAGAPPATRR